VERQRRVFSPIISEVNRVNRPEAGTVVLLGARAPDEIRVAAVVTAVADVTRDAATTAITTIVAIIETIGTPRTGHRTKAETNSQDQRNESWRPSRSNKFRLTHKIYG
jgi:acyl-CoA hydrolase